jgi:hypothetical protein
VTGPDGELVTPDAYDVHRAAWRPADRAYAQLAREIPELRISRYFARQSTGRAENEQAHREMTAALGRLERELAARGYVVALVARSGLWRPSLVVRNPQIAIRTTEISAESGWFWWPDAYRLCPVTDPVRAARLIIDILRLGPGPGG